MSKFFSFQFNVWNTNLFYFLFFVRLTFQQGTMHVCQFATLKFSITKVQKVYTVDLVQINICCISTDMYSFTSDCSINNTNEFLIRKAQVSLILETLFSSCNLCFAWVLQDCFPISSHVASLDVNITQQACFTMATCCEIAHLLHVFVSVRAVPPCLNTLFLLKIQFSLF